jgi:hypothetical protein
MRGFWPVEFLLLKRDNEYALSFNILAQVLFDYHFSVCQLIQSRIEQAIHSYNNIHQVPSLQDIVAS